MHKHLSVCAAWRAAKLLHLTTAMLVLQPKCKGWHDSHECGFSRGWSSQSHSLDVPTYMAGSVQLSWERIEFAIEHVCTQERSNAQSTEKASTKNDKGSKRPSTESTYKMPKKAHSEKHCNLCKKHGGAHTMHNTQDCCRYKKNGKKKSNFQATKNGARKPNSTKQSFTQLCKKMDKLEKAIKKQDTKKEMLP